jgi:two-component system response regulator PilR (NtrC family)
MSAPSVPDGCAPSGVFAVTAVRVLVIDDEPLLLGAWSRTLRAYRVTTAGSVVEALAILASTPDGFDVVVSDLMLGDGTGVDVHRWMASSLAAPPPMLVLTGGAADSEAAEYLRETGVPCALKPISPIALREAIAGLAVAAAPAPIAM